MGVRKIEKGARLTSLVTEVGALGSMIFRPEALRKRRCLGEWEVMRFVCSGGELCK